jgi:hypothetical protein
MKRSVKITLITLIALVVLPALGFCILMTALYLATAGSWPFTPLDKRTHEIALTNGGTVRIEAVEQRGFRSDGWTVYARYQPPGGLGLERIGEWEGYNHHPSVYVTNDLVILPSPDQKTLHVRTRKGEWKFFSMQFPDEHPPFPANFYAALTGLTEEEIRSIRTDISPDEKDWSPSVYLKEFFPESMEVYVLYQTNPDTKRHIRLKLSEDGTRMTLLEVRKEKSS